MALPMPEVRGRPTADAEESSGLLRSACVLTASADTHAPTPGSAIAVALRQPAVGALDTPEQSIHNGSPVTVSTRPGRT
jgi:hypothetical protein